MDGRWTDDDKRKIYETFGHLAVSMDCYGNIDHKPRLRAWQAILEKHMTASELCSAMISCSLKYDKIPTPNQLLAEKFPAERKITQAEFIHAQKEHEKEGFPAFGYYGQIIKVYQRQNREETGVPSQYQILEKRRESPQLSPKLREILAINYGESK